MTDIACFPKEKEREIKRSNLIFFRFRFPFFFLSTPTTLTPKPLSLYSLCTLSLSLSFTQATGLEFPEVTSFWLGDRARCVGAGARTKKIAILSVKVYAVALYVEAEKAARELGVRSRGGFFDDASTADADFCSALADGAFAKALRVDLVRDVDGATFYSALEEALAPKLRLMGGEAAAALKKFEEFFSARKLTMGTSLALLQRVDGGLDVAVCADRARAAAAFASPDAPALRIDAPGFGRSLFEVFLGDSTVVPEARKAWAQGARALLATEQVKRDTRKGGS